MAWNLYQNGEFLKPLKFSNGKTQEDVVKEILKSIKEGEKIIFINGICGTGKSAIALNLAKELGKSSIVVPGKNLQNQYKRDYEGNKYLKKSDKENLKISIMTGRKNHKCQFLADNSILIPKIKKEINLRLHNIFQESVIKKDEDISADNIYLPCKIEIREKNWEKVREYLKKNPKVNLKSIGNIKDVKRFLIAPVCPYWSPVLPSKYELKNLDNVTKKNYEGLNKTIYTYHQRKMGCKFYEQFDSYVNSDVIIFNSQKYKLESVMNRKPLTEVEIIDECDEFLDGFSNQKEINIDRLHNTLIQITKEGDVNIEVVKELFELIDYLKQSKKIQEIIQNKEIISLKETGFYDILKIFLEENWLEEFDEESYLFEIYETARMFKDFLNETYLSAYKKDNNLIINLVTINLAKKMEELVKKNKRIVLMSGTLHSKEILKNIFGLEQFKIIDAETQNQGSIIIKRTGLEMDCKYDNFNKGKYERREYLIALDKCIEVAKRPTLIQINAFKDLPTLEELDNFDLKNLISREEIKKLQEKDFEGELIKKFKNKKINILFSTKDSRGIDFPGDECNSIIFTKYPNPNIDEVFWKVLRKINPNNYWSFYKDKAKRELYQKIYRGLRSNEDKIELLSPDSRVLDFFEDSNLNKIKD